MAHRHVLARGIRFAATKQRWHAGRDAKRKARCARHETAATEIDAQRIVIPVKTGIQNTAWIPAFAGMTI